MTIRLLLMIALLATGAAQATDSGTLTRAESLRAKPFADAAVLAPVSVGSKVEIIIRNGGWYQIKLPGKNGKTGWVRMLSVQRSAAASTVTSSGIASVASGRTGTGKVVSTTGVRGLDSGDISAATFDAAQIAQAEKYRSTAADAAAFAKEARLTPRAATPLPAPAK